MYFWERRDDIRDSHEKSAGCGILVKKERECGIRTPASRPWRDQADPGYFSTEEVIAAWERGCFVPRVFALDNPRSVAAILDCPNHEKTLGTRLIKFPQPISYPESAGFLSSRRTPGRTLGQWLQ